MRRKRRAWDFSRMKGAAMDEVVGFIGLGTMGLPMVRNLSAAGVQVLAYDANPQAMQDAAGLAGVRYAAHPREVAEASAILITCLPNNDAVDAVFRGEEGVLQGAREGLITCDFSTVSPDFTQALHSQLQARGVAHFEAPMLGSKPQSEAGEVFFILAGGEEAQAGRLKPLLDIVGRMHMYVGPPGTGNKIKLMHNALGAVNYCAVAESLAVCAANGVDLNTYYEVVCSGGGMAYSNYFERKVPTIIKGDYSPRFRLALALKDINMARAVAAQAGVPVPVMEEARQTLEEAVADGYGDEDASAVTHVIEKRMGRKISQD
ncbi:MAG: NAD(P)-dependent oxidoreductase [SAR324 cluster bacterium]|nr:NAD(P)-dependent oxidoreductase [SAR324 cluster bacterium]